MLIDAVRIIELKCKNRTYSTTTAAKPGLKRFIRIPSCFGERQQGVTAKALVHSETPLHKQGASKLTYVI